MFRGILRPQSRSSVPSSGMSRSPTSVPTASGTTYEDSGGMLTTTTGSDFVTETTPTGTGTEWTSSSKGSADTALAHQAHMAGDLDADLPSNPQEAYAEMNAIRSEVLRLEAFVRTVKQQKKEEFDVSRSSRLSRPRTMEHVNEIGATRSSALPVTPRTAPSLAQGRAHTQGRTQILQQSRVLHTAPAGAQRGRRQQGGEQSAASAFLQYSSSAVHASTKLPSLPDRPRKYETSPVFALFCAAEERKMIPQNRSWQSLAAPSLSHPNSRSEAVRLTQILESMLSQRTRFMEYVQDYYCSPHVHELSGTPDFDYAALGEELYIYDVVFGDLVNKARLECIERAELLERIRSRLMELMFICTAHMSKLESQHKKDVGNVRQAKDLQHSVADTAINMKNQLAEAQKMNSQYRKSLDILKSKLEETSRNHDLEITKMKDQDNENKWLIRDLERRVAIAAEEKNSLAAAYESQMVDRRAEISQLNAKIEDLSAQLVQVDTGEASVMTEDPFHAIDISPDILRRDDGIVLQQTTPNSLSHLLGPGSLSGKVQNKLMISRLCSYIYMRKLEHDLDTKTRMSDIVSFGDFVYDYHLETFGKRTTAEYHLKNLVATIHRYSADSTRVSLFGRLLGCHPDPVNCPEIPINSQIFFLYALSCLQHVVGAETFPWYSSYDDGSAWITEEQAIASVFVIMSSVGGEAQRRAAEKVQSIAVTEFLSLGQERRIVDVDKFLECLISLWEDEIINKATSIVMISADNCNVLDQSMPPEKAVYKLCVRCYDDFWRVVSDIEPATEKSNDMLTMYKEATHIGGDDAGHITLSCMLWTMRRRFLGPWRFSEKGRWLETNSHTEKAKMRNLHSLLGRTWKQHEKWVRNALKQLGLRGVSISRYTDMMQKLQSEIKELHNPTLGFELLCRILNQADLDMSAIRDRNRASGVGQDMPEDDFDMI
eukprot:Rmarinus@m.6135